MLMLLPPLPAATATATVTAAAATVPQQRCRSEQNFIISQQCDHLPGYAHPIRTEEPFFMGDKYGPWLQKG